MVGVQFGRVRLPAATVCVPTCENAVGEKPMGALVGYRARRTYRSHGCRGPRNGRWSGVHRAYKPSQVLKTANDLGLIAYDRMPRLFILLTNGFKRGKRATAGEDLTTFRQWHYEANRDREAHLRNTARLPGFASRGAGSRNAGHFLKHFTDSPITHLDIFGSTWNWAGDAPGAGYGATGAPFRTLLRALKSMGA